MGQHRSFNLFVRYAVPKRAIQLSLACLVSAMWAQGATETVLHTFVGAPMGGGPESGVILNTAGELFGVTLNGGPGGNGVVYKVSPAGHETLLYSFTGGRTEAIPRAR
jgi:uncharacterized repeat protein (TIGR03803 family)